jgi:cytoskeletal protein CcmA (bactofilin family)
MPDPMHKTLSPVADIQSARTILGPSVTLRGELASDEDLTIEGKFDGTLHLPAHCLTVGPQGQVKADIQTSRAIVQGAVTGNITASERIEIRKTGRVMGDLVAPGISIEDGAYFKGSIEIVREESTVHSPALVRVDTADD